MSGICGIVHRAGGHVLEDKVQPMLSALNVSGQKGITRTFGPVAFGAQAYATRLSGISSMTVHGRPFALALHGTLYNLREVCPIETEGGDVLSGLLRLFAKEKVAALSRLKGEFALAVWDGCDEVLYLATDRFRVHPILYYCGDDKFVFSSRMNGIGACASPGALNVDPGAIVDFLANSIVPTPKSIYREVKKLPPGHVLILSRGGLKLECYWDINFLDPSRLSEAELADQLRHQFAEALTSRVQVDGQASEIGTFLSGGVDSSTVTGVLTQLRKRPLKSFSIGFKEQQFNEIAYARLAARSFGAAHTEYFVTPQDTIDTIPRLIEAFDEPFANASAIPTYFCSKVAREHGVSVLYAGDGGDELFAGNERYALNRLFEYYSQIPSWLRGSLIKPAVFTLADLVKHDLLVSGKKYILRASIPYPKRLYSYGLFSVVPMADLLAPDLLQSIGATYNPNAHLDRYYTQAPARTDLDRQLYVDLKVVIADNDLFKVSRMAEAAGITVQYPFLDQQLAEFAATVPANMKMRGRELRSFFKRAFAELLPVEIRKKKKHGFGLPIPVWLKTDAQLNEMMHDLVLSPRSVQRGYFNKRSLEELVRQHKHDQTSFYGSILWNLMILELWHRRYMSGSC